MLCFPWGEGSSPCYHGTSLVREKPGVKALLWQRSNKGFVKVSLFPVCKWGFLSGGVENRNNLPRGARSTQSSELCKIWPLRSLLRTCSSVTSYGRPLKTIFLSFLEAAFNQVLLVLQKVLCASSIPAFQIGDNTVIILKTVNLSFVLNIFLCFMISFAKPPSSKYTQLGEQHSPSQKQDLPPDQTHNYISLLHLSLKAPFPLKHQ